MGIPVRREAPKVLSLSLSLASSANVASHDLLKESNRTRVFNLLFENVEQNVLIDAIKEFLYIALERVTRPCVIFTHFSDRIADIKNSTMSSFADTARERSGNIDWLKYGNQNLENRMVKHSVTHRGFVDSPQFRVVDPKSSVWSVLVRPILQISIEIKNILFKIKLEFHNVGLVPFIGFENFPGVKERLGRNYRPV